MRFLALVALALASQGPASAQLATLNSESTGVGIAGASSSFINAPVSDIEGSDLSKRAPTIFVPGLAGGTNPCIVSTSGGVTIGGTGGIPGFGVSGGKASVEKECEVRESLRLAAALSPKEPDRKQRLFLKNIACQSKVFAKALELTSAETNDANYSCYGALPKGIKNLGMRNLKDRGAIAQVDSEPRVYEYAGDDEVLSSYASMMEGTD